MLDRDSLEIPSDLQRLLRPGTTQPESPANVRRSSSLLVKAESSPHKLGQLAATAIAANDITSSCLYVAGVAAFYAGVWAPIALVLVSGILLYLFRRIYAEVVTALPVNGGTYTVLLNTTSKSIASLAGSLTFLSYTATAVVGASVAIAYLRELLPQVPQLWATVAVLGFFAVLNLIGIKESSKVAILIFAVHMLTIIVLIVDCAIWTIFSDRGVLLKSNFSKRSDPLPDGRIPAAVAEALLYGFASAMLGITGFETSANYVEEQKQGVFPKTLRNMWICVAIINPVLSLLSFSVLEMSVVMGYPLDAEGRPNNDNLLILMARTPWVANLVSVDAFLVLAGSVLTSFVGVCGLVRRMAYDECFPKFLLAVNPWFKTNHVIILGFFLVCSSLYFIVNGNTLVLASVYAVSFLLVMCLFCVGNLILKYKRSRIKRDTKARVWVVILALSCCLVAVYVNVLINTKTLKYFFLYYGVTLFIVLWMFQRSRIYEVMIKALVDVELHSIEDCLEVHVEDISGIRGWILRIIKSNLREIQRKKCIFFIKERDIRLMNKVIAYVRDNEQVRCLVFVHCQSAVSIQNTEMIEKMKSDLTILKTVYPKLDLTFHVEAVNNGLSGSVVKSLGKILGVPSHLMFISCPSEKFPYDIAMLGGVRLITH